MLNKHFTLSFSYGAWYYLILFASFFFIFLFLSLSLLTPERNIYYKIWASVTDSLFFLLLCELPRRKWKAIIVLLPLLLSILIFVNILYYRNFADLIPPSLYLRNNALDPLVLTAAKTSLRGTDLFIIIPALTPLIFLIIFWKKGVKDFQNRLSTILITLLIFLFFLITPNIITYCKNIHKDTSYNIEDHFEHFFPDSSLSWRYYYDSNNFTVYIIKCISEFFRPKFQLTPNDKENIRKHLSKYAEQEDSNKIIESIEPKVNLIMIVVESLPYQIFDLQESKKVAPVLNSLIEDSTTILVKCDVLTGLGRSSDAHFIYNTGLLPLRDQPLTARYASKNYPSLSKALGIHSLEIIGENKTLWAHQATSISYGFKSLISGIANNTTNQDSLIFTRAAVEIGNIKTPFFLFLTTLSMHNPYNKPMVSHNPELDRHIKSQDSRDREYLQRLNHFDKSLSLFLQKLKQKNLYDNSLIVILGDHEIGAWEVSPYLQDNYIPFIIINGPKLPTLKDGLTQLDVFPTILDLFKIKYQYMDINYRGLGRSIFDLGFPDKEVKEEDYNISQLIICRE